MRIQSTHLSGFRVPEAHGHMFIRAGSLDVYMAVIIEKLKNQHKNIFLKFRKQGFPDAGLTIGESTFLNNRIRTSPS